MERTTYRLIDASLGELQAAVQAGLDGGELPLGGPAVYKVKRPLDTEYRGVQAMYRPAPEPPPEPPPTKEQFIEMAKDSFMRGESGLGQVIEESPVIDVK